MTALYSACPRRSKTSWTAAASALYDGRASSGAAARRMFMTYCLAIKVDDGLILASDSRTHAGVDYVSTYSKMHMFGAAGERFFVLLTAGSLSPAQAVVNTIKRDLENPSAALRSGVARLHHALEHFSGSAAGNRLLPQGSADPAAAPGAPQQLAADTQSAAPLERRPAPRLRRSAALRLGIERRVAARAGRRRLSACGRKSAALRPGRLRRARLRGRSVAPAPDRLHQVVHEMQLGGGMIGEHERIGIRQPQAARHRVHGERELYPVFFHVVELGLRLRKQ